MKKCIVRTRLEVQVLGQLNNPIKFSLDDPTERKKCQLRNLAGKSCSTKPSFDFQLIVLLQNGGSDQMDLELQINFPVFRPPVTL